MTQEEMRSQIEERIDKIESRLAERFAQKDMYERRCFIKEDGVLFAVDCLTSSGALVIEYAENEAEAELNRFEDGDLFYIEDLDEQAMFDAMIREIEN